MLDWFTALAGWFDTHPDAGAWIIGWLAALSISQFVKQFLPLDWPDQRASRVLQIVAIGTGSITSYLLWPAESGHGVLFAAVVGMSAPIAYTLLKAVVAWQFPGLARRLSWSAAKHRPCNRC